MAITWQQVAAPDLTDTSRMLGQGAAGVAGGFKTLADAFNPIREAAKAQRTQTRDLNTLKEISLLDSIKDPNALQERLSQLSPEALAQQYNGAENIDLSKVLSHAQSALPKLQEQITSNQKFGVQQQDFNELAVANDLNEKLYAAKTANEVNALIPEFQALEGKAGADGIKSLNARLKEFESQEIAKEDRTQTLLDRDFSNLQRQNSQEANLYFSSIRPKLEQFGATPDLMNDLESNPFFRNSTPEQQDTYRKQLNSHTTLESSLLPAETKIKLKAENDKVLSEAQGTYDSITTGLNNEEKKVQENLSYYEDNSGALGIMKDLSNISGIVKAADDGTIDSERVGEISESITEIVNQEQSKLAELYGKRNSPVYEEIFNSIPEATKKSLSNEELHKRVRLMAEQKAKDDINPRVIYKTIKDAGFKDPVWFSSLSENDSVFKNKLAQNAEEFNRLKKKQDDINKSKTQTQTEYSNKLRNQADILQQSIMKSVGTTSY